MSMTQKKAAKWVEDLRDRYRKQAEEYEAQGALIPMDALYPYIQALDLVLTALRPVSRERVEKVWKGEWMGSGDGYADGELVYDTWTCSECGHVIDEEDDPDMLPQFCPKCYAAMTDEAVEMVMERMEALKDGSTTD